MSERFLAALLAVFVGVLVGSARSWSQTPPPSATGLIAVVPGSTNTYTFTLTVGAMEMTAGEPLECVRLLAVNGVQVESVDQPSGAQTTLIPGQGFSASFNPPLQVDMSLTWTFTTAAPYPANGGGALTVSADCSQDFAGLVTGPAATTTTTTETPTSPAVSTSSEQLCKCVQLRVSMNPADVYTAAGQLAPERDPLARLGGLGRWSMVCSAGAGNCSGVITVIPPPGDKAQVFAPSSFVPSTGQYKGKMLYRKGKPMPLTFTCSGPCKAMIGGTFFLQLDSSGDLLPAERGGKAIKLRFVVKCTTSSTQTFTFAFKPNGDLNRVKSVLG